MLFFISTDLLRIAGGGVQKKMYLPILRSFHEKLKHYRQSQIVQLPAVNVVTLVTYSEDVKSYDPKHPKSIEVEKQRRRWDEIMTKYELEVNNTVKQLIADQFSTKRNIPGIRSGVDLQRRQTTSVYSEQLDAVNHTLLKLFLKLFQ